MKQADKCARLRTRIREIFHENRELVNTMLDTAISQLKKGEKPVIHTDCGCHYRWPTTFGKSSLPLITDKIAGRPKGGFSEGKVMTSFKNEEGFYFALGYCSLVNTIVLRK